MNTSCRSLSSPSLNPSSSHCRGHHERTRILQGTTVYRIQGRLCWRMKEIVQLTRMLLRGARSPEKRYQGTVPYNDTNPCASQLVHSRGDPLWSPGPHSIGEKHP